MIKRSTQLALAVGFFVLNIGLQAQQIAGQWQGTLNGPNKLHVILKIEDQPSGGLKATAYTIDQSPEPITVDEISFVAQTLKFSVKSLNTSYEGTLNGDGNTINGTIKLNSPTVLNFERATAETAWKIDPSLHTVKMIPVDKDVTLEVLDWGGTGRPLVLLTGLGDNAHAFDRFAPKLTDKYHVYGITRRGFGESSKPAPVVANYTAARLGDDVLAVIDAMHIYKPVIAGHSIAGEELSYIGSAHPDKVAGLIYLDAGYPYAMYDEVNGNFTIDVVALQQQLALVLPGSNTAPADQKKVLDDLSAKLQRVSAEVAETRSDAEKMPSPPQGGKMPPIGAAILGGQQRFTTVSAPALAIYALPHNLGPLLKDNPQARAAFQSINDRNTTRQATAFERQVPSAHVVRLSNATHFIFFSNEADVLREMNGFIAALPAAN